MSIPHRQYFSVEFKREGDYNEEFEDRHVCSSWDANVISSIVSSDRMLDEPKRVFGEVVHSPVLDIDFAARLLPSSTPGHFHLYLDGLELPWPKYRALLLALAQFEVLEQGYVDASISRGATFVRKPGVMKAHPLTPDHIGHETSCGVHRGGVCDCINSEEVTK